MGWTIAGTETIGNSLKPLKAIATHYPLETHFQPQLQATSQLQSLLSPTPNLYPSPSSSPYLNPSRHSTQSTYSPTETLYCRVPSDPSATSSSLHRQPPFTLLNAIPDSSTKHTVMPYALPHTFE